MVEALWSRKVIASTGWAGKAGAETRRVRLKTGSASRDLIGLGLTSGGT